MVNGSGLGTALGVMLAGLLLFYASGAETPRVGHSQWSYALHSGESTNTGKAGKP